MHSRLANGRWIGARFTLLSLLILLAGCGGSPASTSPTVTNAPATPQPAETGQPIETAILASATPYPTQPPTATRFFPTSSVRERMTLPPSWTPTITPSVTRTPTITLTPTPTLTPTLTPTRSLEALCEGIVAYLEVEPGREYEFSETIPFVIASDDPNVSFELRLENEAADFIEVIPFEAGQVYIGQFLLETLDDPGAYRWTVTANRGDATGLCQQIYTFTIQEPSLLDTLVDAISTVNANTGDSDGTGAATASSPPLPTATYGLLIPPEVEATLNALVQTPLPTITASPTPAD